MQLIDRSRDVVTGDVNLEVLHSMSNFPVFMGCVDHSQSEDLFADMVWQISKGAGVVQLKKIVPVEILYHSQHDAGTVGSIWMAHHRSFSKFLSKFIPSSVLELGGAHGILSQEFQKYSEIPWTIVEPNPSPVQGCNARFIKEFFDDKFVYSEAFDTVVHSHVFEHMYEPAQFMGHLAGLMDEGKQLVFSLPNMQAMLERKYTNCINFEHSIFLTEPYVEFLLAKHGFRLVAKDYFMDDHSIFYAAIRDSSVKPIALPGDLYERNRKLYLDYVQYYEELVDELNHAISETKQPTFLFGAHVFAQHLIECGLDTSGIVSLLDNDPNKQGKRLYGTNLMVQSPKVLRDLLNPAVILKAGVYNQEIKEDILANINRSVVFLE